MWLPQLFSKYSGTKDEFSGGKCVVCMCVVCASALLRTIKIFSCSNYHYSLFLLLLCPCSWVFCVVWVSLRAVVELWCWHLHTANGINGRIIDIVGLQFSRYNKNSDNDKNAMSSFCHYLFLFSFISL